jgi:tRNA (cytidine/uridine-2'-O-)-methyltransferase
MFHIVLVAPEIPPNTGNAIRLAANTGCTLHLVEPLGFSMDDKHMRRAGLDYHEYTRVLRHASWQALLASAKPAKERMFAMTTRGSGSVYDAHFQAGDWLVFGSETQGLPAELREQFAPGQRLRLAHRTDIETRKQTGAVGGERRTQRLRGDSDCTARRSAARSA